jgi:hypothetical protein
MRPFPLTIHSDQEAATALLGEIAALCAAHGAQWHPDLRAEVAEGAMRLLAPQGTAGPLITMPTPLLVPIEAARWGDGATALELLAHPESTTPVQRELLQLQAALYNATGKLCWWSTQHPARLVEHCPAVAEALLPLKPGHGKGPQEATATERFLATRSFGWKADPQEGPSRAVLMPLIDLLNHHHRGAPYRIDAGAMRIATAQPDNSGECFAHYGHRRDGLDLALHYGHADSSTPFAHCAPMQINVDGVGSIQVEYQGRSRPAHPLDPPRVGLEEGGVRISHLCCHLEHPERVRIVLKLALQAGLQRRGHPQAEAQRLAQRGLEAFGAANIGLLGHLITAAEAADHPGGAVLARAARRQTMIIEVVMG